MSKNRRGFTLIELIIAVAIAVIATGVAFTALSPAKRMATARNQNREAQLQAVLAAVRENIADTRTNSFSCSSGALPTTATRMASSGGYDIAPCLVPVYLHAMPFDPSGPNARYVSQSDYDTGFNIFQNASTGQVTVAAPYAESGKVISFTR